MKKELINIGNKSKKAITSQINSKKKNKLKQYKERTIKSKIYILKQFKTVISCMFI